MRSLATLAALYVPATAITALIALAVGSPFSLWFRDTPIILGLLLGMMLILGIAWDGLLICVGCVAALLRSGVRRASTGPTLATLRGYRFFSCGPMPIPILLATGFAVLGSSNFTLINLHLLQSVTQWRDPLLWQIESGLLTQLQHLSIDVAAWDRLYHSAWGIEVVAAFALVLLARGPRIVLQYGATMIVVFHLGRLLGVLNPVQGPAFYRPEQFAYLKGSTTDKAMQMVADLLTRPIDQLIDRGGVLLGGVSAMPSLHVAMVAVTAYWLARAQRWTLLMSVPWMLAVWASTVVLGWHYVLDGAGGIALAAASVALTLRLPGLSGKGPE